MSTDIYSDPGDEPAWVAGCIARMNAAYPGQRWEYVAEIGGVACVHPPEWHNVYYATDAEDEALLHWWIAHTGDSNGSGAHPHDPVKAMQVAIKRMSVALASSTPKDGAR